MFRARTEAGVIESISRVFNGTRSPRRLFSTTKLVPEQSRALDHDVTDQGERISPEANNFCYFAHLSLYAFAKVFVPHKHVLDAGCGTGYGSAYFLEAGARSVLGVDISAKAVNHCRQRYEQPRLKFQVMDLERERFSIWKEFDMVYCSNVMEHLSNPDSFLESLLRLLPRDGVFILAVPPITSRKLLEANLENPYHLTNITPQQWLTKVRRYFQHAQGYRHWVEPEFVLPSGQLVQDHPILERNFTFTEKMDAEMMSQPSITTLIVARDPRRKPLPAVSNESTLPPEWRIDPLS